MYQLKKRDKRLIGVSLLIILLYFGQNYIQGIIKSTAIDVFFERLSRETDYAYSFNTTDVDVLFLENSIRIESFEAIPTSQNTKNSEYEVGIEELNLKIESFWNLVFNKELIIKRLNLIKPSLSIYLHQKDTLEDLTFQSKMYRSLDRYLNLFEVESFNIDDASIAVTNADGFEFIDIGNLDLNVDKFYMVGGKEGQSFLTENVELFVSNELFQFENGTTLAFDSLLFSLKEKKIECFQLALIPSDTIKNRSIQIPYLGLKGIDFYGIYNRKVTQIDTLILERPQILFELGEGEGNSNITEKISQLLLKRFEAFKLNTFYIQNGSIAILKQEDSVYYTDDFVLRVADIKIDSTLLIDNPGYFDLIDWVELSVNDLEVNNLKKVSLNLQNFFINSQDSILEISNLGMGIRSKSDTSNIRVEYVLLDGFAWNEDKNTLIADGLFVQKPSLDIKAVSLMEEEVESARNEGFKYNLERLVLQNGRFLRQSDSSVIEVNSFDFETTRVSNVSGDLEIIEMLKKALVQLNGVSITNKEDNYSIGSFDVSNENRLITLSDINFKNGTVSDVEIYGLNYDSIFKNIFSWDSLLVKEADLLFQSDTSKSDRVSIDSVFNLLDFDKISLSEIDLTYLTKNGKIKVETLNGNIVRQDSITFISDLDGFDLFVEQPSVVVSSQAFSYDHKDSLFTIRKIIADSPEMGRIVLDSIGIERLGAFFERRKEELYEVKFLFYQPDFNLKINKSEKKNKAKNTSFPIPEFSIINGNLNLEIEDTQIRSNQLFVNSVKSYESLNLDSLIQNMGISTRNIEVNDPNFNKIALDHFRHKPFDKNIELSGLDLQKAPTEDLAIESITLDYKGFSVDSFYIHIDSVSIQRPNITWLSTNDSSKVKPDEKQVIDFPLIVDAISLNEGDFTYNIDGTPTAFNQIVFYGNNLNLNNTSLTKLLTQSDFYLTGKDFKWVTTDSVYLLTLDSYQVNTYQDRVGVWNVNVVPLKNKDQFTEGLEYQTDRFDIGVSSVIINGFNREKLLIDSLLQASSVAIDGLDLEVYRDKRIPFRDSIYKPLLASELRKIPPFQIDSIYINADKIVSEEFVKDALQKGAITFNDIDAIIVNVTNLDSLLALDNQMTLTSEGYIEGQGLFSVDVIFDLTSPVDEFKMKGKVEAFDLTSLNPILEHVAFVKVKSGTNNDIEFDFNAGENYASGEMKFLYKDLKIQVINKETHEANKGFSTSLMTFFANTFVVNTKNPHFIFVRDGDIFYERNKNKSIFNYWSKSILSGVVASVGAVNNKKEIRKMNKAAKQRLKQEEKTKN